MECNIEKSTEWFCGEMRKKLHENERKDGWDLCSDTYLMQRICEEIFELHAELTAEEKHGEHIVREAADVANFAMMIADRHREG